MVDTCLKKSVQFFSFLTIIPSNNTNLETVARYMHVFPIIGIAIGLLIGSIGFGLSFFLEPLIVSLLVVASIAIITGIHHTDGLADFADGLMTRGTKEKKRNAMKDLSTGSAGIVSVVLSIVGVIIALSLTTGYELFQAILLSEILAKFSMVLMASIGKSAATVGSNSPFMQIMKDKRRLTVAGVITIIPLVVIGGTTGLILFGASIGVTLFLIGLSTRSFGGITGDVLGAANELTRLSSLLIFVSL